MSRAVTSLRLRCAIYTRKSSEEGLDQSFNSLHAQREACEAFVLSQTGEGWSALKAQYDDGGFSGGTMERPALQRLLADIEAGRIDIVVVYKVDRLTRSLADFAKIVDTFDRRSVSFVSVTQAFNTTTSMGRLTLNVLLSFAQFEREVTGERIRDKIAASKAKGMWMGGVPPLGYDPPTDLTSRALVVNAAEAETVRLVFARYLELGSVHELQRWLAANIIRPKAWITRRGLSLGGQEFSRGALFHLLKNRLYVGEITHRGQAHPGAHPAIIEREQFDTVQALLASQARRHRDRPRRVATMMLRGRVFDAEGAPMNPTFGHGARGQVYRYYVSAPPQQGKRTNRNDGVIRRVPAPAIEDLVAGCLRRLAGSDAPVIEKLLVRVEVHPATVQLVVRRTAFFRSAGDPTAELAELERRLPPGERITPEPTHADLARVTLPCRLRFRGGRIHLTDGSGKPIVDRPEADATLIKALRAAHVMLADGSGERIGAMDRIPLQTAPASPYHRSILRLAFLAPDIQAMILEGRQPLGLNLQRLMQGEIAAAWEDQRRSLLERG